MTSPVASSQTTIPPAPVFRLSVDLSVGGDAAGWTLYNPNDFSVHVEWVSLTTGVRGELHAPAGASMLSLARPPWWGGLVVLWWHDHRGWPRWALGNSP